MTEVVEYKLQLSAMSHIPAELALNFQHLEQIFEATVYSSPTASLQPLPIVVPCPFGNVFWSRDAIPAMKETKKDKKAEDEKRERKRNCA